LVSFAQKNDQPIGAIGFYNLENLFDTVDDTSINDEDYLPEGRNKWTPALYEEKLNNMAKVISEMVGAPDILGVCEIENRKVLEDLVNTTALKPHKYQIIQFDSPDWRGIDVALLYKTGTYLPFETEQITFEDPKFPDFKTRDILKVKGLYLGDTLNVFVNHWPSRRGGKEDKRVKAGLLLRQAVDATYAKNPDAKIVIMGDFNDDPNNKSVKTSLRASGKVSKLEDGDLYNTSYDTFKQGYGTLFYRGTWNLFDQIIISQSLLRTNSSNYHYMAKSFSPFGPNWIRVQKEGEYQGAPKRTFVRGVYQGGYSDHFASYIIIGKK
jgi:predicted extracellular nuclease